MNKRIASLTTALIVVGAGWAGATTAAAAEVRGGCANHGVRTFKVEGHALKDQYRVGETAEVAVSVVRSAEPTAAQASAAGDSYHRGVEGAQVGVILTVDGKLFAGGAVTDESGSAVVEIDIDRPVRSGWAVAGGRAWKELVGGPCPVTEEGVLWARKLFRVVGTH